jgi:hypothetical protein
MTLGIWALATILAITLPVRQRVPERPGGRGSSPEVVASTDGSGPSGAGGLSVSHRVIPHNTRTATSCA